MHGVKSKATEQTKAQSPSGNRQAMSTAHNLASRPQQMAGNQAVQRLGPNNLTLGWLPSATRVAHPDAKTEREASKIGERRDQLQINPGRIPPSAVSVGAIPGTAGNPLPESVKRDQHVYLRGSLSQVRVHDDPVAHAFTRSIGAKAATWGSHIYFGNNHFDPHSQTGRRLLAHELVHTTQPEARTMVHRAPEDDVVLKKIEAELGSKVITDERRAELLARQAVLADKPKFDLLALAQEAETRKKAREAGGSACGGGPTSVSVPLSALMPELEPLSGEALFYELIASPSEEEAQQLAVDYVLDQYLEGKLDWQVKVDLIEPDTGGVFFLFNVQGTDLIGATSLELPLSVLDSISEESLDTVTRRGTQIVEVAALYNAFDAIVSQIGKTPENIIESPEDYARNESDSLLTIASRYTTRLISLSKYLLPENAWLAGPIQNRIVEFAPVLQRVTRAGEAAYKFHSENQPPTYAGETYDRVIRESSGTAERIGWKIWRGIGDFFTLGGQSAQAENVGMYRRGEISRTAYRKNWVLVIGGVAVKAVITALTAGRGTSLAMRFLGLEAGTTAAVATTGAIEGVTTGFTQAFSADLYAKAVATVSSSPGVVAFHERIIGGPSSWFESAAWGGIAGGALSFGSTFLPKRPFDPKGIPREPVSEPTASAVDAAVADVRVLSADLQTGEITLAVRHPVTGELFSAKGNVNTGNATIRNLSTGEVVGYVREGEFGPPAPGGELPGTVVPPEPAVAPAAKTSVSPVGEVLAPAAEVKGLTPGPETVAPPPTQEVFGAPTPETFGPPAPETSGPPAPRQTAAFAPDTAPRNVRAVTAFLRESGLTQSEIISFGGADASRLGPTTSARVARLAEHFTGSDIKALGEFLDRYNVVIDDGIERALVNRVEPGALRQYITHLEVSADMAQRSGLEFDMEGAIHLTVAERIPSATGDFPWIEPAWRAAERELGPVLERTYGTGWQVSPRVPAPGALPGETLGSTVPEYYHPGLTQAFEVKRFDLNEMGIGRAGEDLGRISRRTIRALARARRQLAGREWALPEGTQQNIVFNVTDQGVTNVQAVGLRLRATLRQQLINYNRVFVQNGDVLTEIPATE